MSVNLPCGNSDYSETEPLLNHKQPDAEAVSTISSKLKKSPASSFIIVLLYFMSLALIRLPVDVLIYNKYCIRDVQDVALCTNNTVTKAHPNIQAQSAHMQNYMSLIYASCSIMSNLIINNYTTSRRHTKLMLLLPCAGLVLTCCFLLSLTIPATSNWPVEILLLKPLLYGGTGSHSLVLSVTSTYLVTLANRRAVNPSNYLIMMETMPALGSFVGSIISGPIIDNVNIRAVFIVSLVLSVILLVLVLSFFDPTLDIHDHNTRTCKASICSKVRDSLKLVRSKSERKSCLLLCMSIFAYSGVFIGFDGYRALTFLYFVKQRGMNLTEKSIYDGSTVVLSALIGTFLVTKSSKLVNHMTVGVLCYSSVIFGYLLISLNFGQSLLWIGGFMTIPLPAIYAIIRSLQASFVPQSDLFKWFSLLCIFDILTGLLSSQAFRNLYPITLNYWPGASFALSGFVTFLAMVTFVIISVILPSSADEKELEINQNKAS